MAAPIVDVVVTVNTPVISTRTYGTQCFIGSHRWFPERVREYSSKTALAEDMPITSEEYIAGSLALSQSPAPDKILIGRREADAILTPTNVAEGSVHTFTITVNDGDNAVVTYTTGALETAEDVCTAFKTAIDADANVSAHVTTAVVGTGASATLSIVATTASDVFYLTTFTEWSVAYTSTETAAVALAAVQAENDTFAVVSASDHTETFVTGMAAAVEGTDVMYFVSLQEAGSISNAYSETETDIGAKIKQSNYKNTTAFWDDEADTKFPEMGYFAINSRYTPGTVTYVNLQMAGMDTAKNPTTGLVLSSTERTNLDNRNMSYLTVDKYLGVTFVEGGKTGSGNAIDDIRFSHYLTSQLREALGALLLAQKGKKLGGDPGITKVLNTCQSAVKPLLTDSTTARGLDSIRFFFPRNKDISPVDRAAGVLKGKFTGYLTGAFGKIYIEGELTYAGL